MTLRRLLIGSVRRYSSNPYPFHSPFPPSATPTRTSTDPPTYPNSSTTPNNHYSAPYNPPQPPYPYADHYSSNATASNYSQFPPTAAPTPFAPQAPTTSTAPNNYYSAPYNPPYPNPNQFYSSSAQNPQSSTTSNHSQFPSAAASAPFAPQPSYGFSSAEEAAAERRRRKRRLRIEPPLYALRPNPQSPPSNAGNPDKPKLPDSTSALVGPRLNLHNRVQSLIRAGDLDAASYVARQSVFQYVRPTVFTCNAIIAAMYRANRYSDAKALFQYFFRQFEIIPNIVSYNNLIVSHCESNEVDDALKVYEYIIENAPYSPSAVTYRHLTKGLIDAGRIDDAANLLREMLLKGHGADSLVFNNVILGFLNLGNLEKANELFDELKGRCTVYDGVVNATFMDWFFNQGKPKEAMESYRDLMAKDYRMVPATRNVLLETLLRHGKKKEAWDLFHDMLDDHTPPTFQAVNSDTFNMMVNECFKEGNVQMAKDVFVMAGKGVKSKPFQMDVAGFNNMMMRMCELELMDEAEQYYKQLCDKSLSPDVNTYKIMIDAYIKVDRVDYMIEKYMKMVEVGLRVIPPYANKWFGYLIARGKASDCLPILSKMTDKEPKPDVSTYDIVIRALIKDGDFDTTSNLLREMMNQGIGTTPSLKEFVLDAFEGLGRRPEIENILNRFSSTYPQHRPYQGARSMGRMAGPPETVEQGGRNPAMPWQRASSPQISYANQFTHQTSQAQNAQHISYANQFTHQTSQAQNAQHMSYANQFTHQTSQAQNTQQMEHTNPTSEQEVEVPRVAGQNAA
ncbi:hypothetical protein ACS0TY_002326 [Phlomoides rotata]